MGAGAGKGVPIDEASLAAQYKLSPEQIHALIQAFKAGSPKMELDKGHFIQVVRLVREKHPELTTFDDEVAGLVFVLCDTDHSGYAWIC